MASRADKDMADVFKANEAIAAANGGAVNDTTSGGGKHAEDRKHKRGKGMIGSYKQVAEDRDRDTKGTGLVENGGFW